MDRLRVLHILWSANAGGIAKVVYDLVHCQKKNEKLHVEILVCKNEGEYLEKFSEIAVTCTVLSMKNGMNFSSPKYRKLKNLFSGFDIIHIHSFNPFTGWVAANSRKKIIYTEHGNFGFGRNASLVEKATSVLQKTFLNRYVDLITFNSAFSKQVAQKRFGLKKKPQKIVYNGIPFNDLSTPDPNMVEKQIREKIKDSFVIGVSARFVEVKRIDRLIEAFATFSRGKMTFLMLCGDGPLRSNYLQLAEKLEISERTIFAGFISSIRNYQALFNVAVIPSQGEAFGLAAVETLALGIPTIVFSDGGGLPEIIGPLCKEDVVRDQNQLVNRLKYYFEKTDDLQDRQKRISYACTFDIEKMERNFFEIYKSIA